MSDTKLDDAAKNCVRQYKLIMMNDDTPRMAGQHYMRWGFKCGARWALAELEAELAKEREYSAETHARFEEQLERIKELEARHFNGNADLVVKCDRLTAHIQELEAEVERLKPKPRMSDPGIGDPDEKLSRAVLRIKQLEEKVEHLKSCNLKQMEAISGYEAQLEATERERDKYKSALWKIAEAEHMGYGTQRTYGEMAQQALEGDGES
jgi:DNA repair exonuclease SbcCD ATPase subunit